MLGLKLIRISKRDPMRDFRLGKFSVDSGPRGTLYTHTCMLILIS